MKKIICALMAFALLFSLCACSGGDNADTTTTAKNVEINLTEIMTEIESTVTLPDNMDDITNSDLLLQYYGIDAADVKSFAVKINGTGIKCDEIVMIEAADADALGRIKTCLENRLEDVKSQMDNYLPDEYKIASACSVQTVGNYATLFISPDAKAMTDLFNSKF